MASESDITSQSDVSSSESEVGDGEPLELGSSDLEGDGRGEEGTEEQAGEVEMFINIFGGIKSYKGVTVYHLSFFLFFNAHNSRTKSPK